MQKAGIPPIFIRKKEGTTVKHRISRENYNHSRAIIKKLDKENLRLKGLQIYHWCKNNLGNNLDWKLVKFAVVKKDIFHFKRGDKIFGEDISKWKAKGVQTREIVTFNKHTRKSMKPLAQYLDLEINTQHGFHANKSVITAHKEIAGQLDTLKLFQNPNKAILCIDLQDAFNQITKEQVYAIFRLVFNLNSKHALELAEKSTYKGYLFQGNPIAPLLFNIWSIRLTNFFDKFQDLKLIQYADDLTFVVDKPRINKSYIKYICKCILKLGFKTKIEKIATFNNSRKYYEMLGIKMIQGKPLAIKHRKLKRKVRYLLHLIDKGLIHSLKKAKDGKAIKLAEIVKGYLCWISNINNLKPSSQLSLPTIK